MTKATDATAGAPRRTAKPLVLGIAAFLAIGAMTAHAASTASSAAKPRAASGFMSASLAALLAAKSPAPAQTPAVSAPAGIPATQLGMNLSTIAYWGQDRAFSNLIYGGNWRHVVPGQPYADMSNDMLNANGWVKSLPAGHQAVINLSQPVVGPGGSMIRCTYQGDGDLNVGGSISNVQRGTRSITFRLNIRYPARENLWLSIDRINASNPLRDIDCRETSKSAAEIYDPGFVAEMRNFKVLRFMDWQATNDNATVNWANRNKPYGGVYLGRDGIPVEMLVELVKLTRADPWFNMLWTADDDYVRRFATYVRDNVPANRKIYVETSNEVWNSLFPVAGVATEESQVRNLSSDRFQARLYRYAQRSTEVLKIWTEVFAGQSDRLVRVVAMQHVSPWTSEQVLGFRDTANWVDALATAPYFGHDVTQNGAPRDVNELYSRARTEMANAFTAAKQQKAVASRYGKRYIAYEAGQHVVMPNNLQMTVDFNRDERMYDLYRDYIRRWQTEIGDLITMFSTTGPPGQYGAWGYKDYVGQPVSEMPKLRAMIDSGI